MDGSRLAAFDALLDVETNEAYSNLAVGRAVRRHEPDSAAFARQLVYGVLENQILLDYRLDAFVKSGVKKVKPRARVLLRMGAYQIDFMDSVPDYAAVGETVAIARKKCGGLKNFINGVLRAYARAGGRRALPDPVAGLPGYLSVKYSYCRDITDMWIRMFGAERAESLMKAGNETPPLVICVNTLKTTAGELSERLRRSGFEVCAAKTSGIPEPQAAAVRDHALLVKGSGVLETPEFRDGLFYVQDVSSMRAVAALAPCPGETVMDVCSAPGGKSFFSAMLMKNSGEIISGDIYDHKLRLIGDTAKRLGIKIIHVRKRDAAASDPERGDGADAVIADVPCSGLGVIRRRPEIKLKADIGKLEAIASLQLSILENSARYVKKGGRLMYSTCTVSDAENQKITEEFLKKNKNFIKKEEKQILPDADGSDGFYFCVMQRI